MCHDKLEQFSMCLFFNLYCCCTVSCATVCVIKTKLQMIADTSIACYHQYQLTKKERKKKENKGPNRQERWIMYRIFTLISSSLQARPSSFYSSTSLTSRFPVTSIPASHYKPSVFHFGLWPHYWYSICLQM